MNNTFALLAPGPSATTELAEQLRNFRVGVVNNSYQLAPWAEFLAANDESWWSNHPDAKQFPGDKFSGNDIAGVRRVYSEFIYSGSNSGLLAIEVAKQLGAQRILLLGFDMHGSHFFGDYVNGCSNTPDHRRETHQKQYEYWRINNPQLEVVNCTEGSLLRAFPKGKLSNYV